MRFHTITCAAIVALHCTGAAFAAEAAWTSDYEAAKKKAAVEKKDLLLNFTGSDWSPDCTQLKNEVFSKDEFAKGVKDKFVLVELDFPQDENKLSAETRKQNEELQEKFGADDFPNLMLCDATGRPFAKIGYEPGGAEKYVAHLNELRGIKGKRDQAFAAAAKLEGVEKAKKLVAAFKEMALDDEAVNSFYGDIVAQIKAADPKDETGFTKRMDSKVKLAKFQEDLDEFANKQDHEGALGFVEKALKDDGFASEEKQQVVLTKAMIYAHIKKYDEAIKAVDEAKAVAPSSEFSKDFEKFKARLVEMKNGKEEPEDSTEEPPAEPEKENEKK